MRSRVRPPQVPPFDFYKKILYNIIVIREKTCWFAVILKPHYGSEGKQADPLDCRSKNSGFEAHQSRQGASSPIKKRTARERMDFSSLNYHWLDQIIREFLNSPSGGARYVACHLGKRYKNSTTTKVKLALWPFPLMVRRPAFHAGNVSSILAKVTNNAGCSSGS